MRALAYARATRPDTIEAVTVNVDPADTAALAREWEDRGIPVALKVIDSPFREITKPTLDYVRRARKDSPRDVVAVFIPEYVVGHWWEQILHNQSALRLKGRLLFTPGVMVTSVPWQLSSSDALDQRIRARADRDFPLRARMPGAPQPEDTAMGQPRSNGDLPPGPAGRPGAARPPRLGRRVTGAGPAAATEKSADDLRPGDVVEVEIGPVAHGGHCVARYQGRVVFVRLALPGELVRLGSPRRGRGRSAAATRSRWLRADPERVDGAVRALSARRLRRAAISSMRPGRGSAS